MVAGLLDGWEQVPIGNAPGFAYRVPGPARLVLHSTEGSLMAGAISTYRNAAKPIAPHTTVSPKERRKAQHVNLHKAAYALEHTTAAETNAIEGCIQVEIVGSAQTDPARTQVRPLLEYDLDAGDRAFLAECFDEIRQQVPFPLDYPATGFHAYVPEGGHRLGAEPWRMTDDEWLAFSGICGHQHVVGNVHGDPGRIPIDKIIAAMGGDELTPEQEARIQSWISDTQTLIRSHDKNVKQWIADTQNQINAEIEAKLDALTAKVDDLANRP